jgi:hypothetical protein
MLTFNAQCFAARRQETYFGSFLKNAFRQEGRCLNCVFAAVEDQGHALVPKASDDAGRRIAGLNKTQSRRDYAWDKTGITESSKINEANRFGLSEQPMAYRDRHGGLADAARPDDGYKPVGRQLR